MRIAPRFKRLDAGFTKITNLGKRQLDSARMARIEFVRNRYLQAEKNDIEVVLETHDMPTFWQWENKLLTQELEYYEDHLRRHKAKIDHEVQAGLMNQSQPEIDLLKAPIRRSQSVRLKPRKLKKGEVRLTQEEINAKVESKYADQTMFLINGYDRVRHEMEIHRMQKNYKK